MRRSQRIFAPDRGLPYAPGPTDLAGRPRAVSGSSEHRHVRVPRGLEGLSWPLLRFTLPTFWRTSGDMSELTRMREAIEPGDPKAAEELVPEVYHGRSLSRQVRAGQRWQAGATA